MNLGWIYKDLGSLIALASTSKLRTKPDNLVPSEPSGLQRSWSADEICLHTLQSLDLKPDNPGAIKTLEISLKI